VEGIQGLVRREFGIQKKMSGRELMEEVAQSLEKPTTEADGSTPAATITFPINK